MWDSFAESRLESVRADLRALQATTSQLQGKLDAHIREADEERRRQEQAKDIRFMVLIGIIWVLDFVLILMPSD